MTMHVIDRPHSNSLSLHVDFRSRLGISGAPANNRNTDRFRCQWRVLEVSAFPRRAGIEIDRVRFVGCAPATREAAPALQVSIDDALAVVPGREPTRVPAVYAGIERTTRVAIGVPR
jgi:hypothetical protein